MDSVPPEAASAPAPHAATSLPSAGESFRAAAAADIMLAHRRCDDAIVFCHSVILSFRHSVTLSLSHSLILSFCHSLPFLPFFPTVSHSHAHTRHPQRRRLPTAVDVVAAGGGVRLAGRPRRELHLHRSASARLCLATSTAVQLTAALLRCAGGVYRQTAVPCDVVVAAGGCWPGTMLSVALVGVLLARAHARTLADPWRRIVLPAAGAGTSGPRPCRRNVVHHLRGHAPPVRRGRRPASPTPEPSLTHAHTWCAPTEPSPPTRWPSCPCSPSCGPLRLPPPTRCSAACARRSTALPRHAKFWRSCISLCFSCSPRTIRL